MTWKNQPDGDPTPVYRPNVEAADAEHNVRICPACGEKLKAGKRPYVSGSGFIYRERRCLGCFSLVFTKQGPEEITGVKPMS